MHAELALSYAFDKIEPIATRGMRNYFNVHYNRFVETLELVSKYCKPRYRILDIGCFPGFLTVAMSALDYTVYGVDLETSDLEVAQGIGIEIFQCNIENENLPFSDQYFDFVVFSEVIEHISPFSVSHVIYEINRVLKRGGYLLISTPNLVALENRFFFLLGRAVIPSGHAREYTLNEIVNLLSSCFAIVENRYSMARDIITVRHVQGIDEATRDHVLKGFLKHRHWKNTGRVLAYPLKKFVPSLRSIIFVVARKRETCIRETHSLNQVHGFI